MKALTLRRAMASVLGLRAPTFDAWRALILGAFGEDLSTDEARTFATLTGGRTPPTQRVRELICGVGRRGGKNFVAARLAVYLATLNEWPLAPGEVGVVLVLASTRDQAQVAFRYVKGAFDAHPALAAEVASTTATTIVLRSGIEVRIATADNASVRGVTLLAAILDEFAFWVADDAREVLRAVRPAMATQPNAMLVIISSVYSTSSPLAELHRQYYGVDDPQVLFALATTRQMNPTITQEFIDAELARDPANRAEYLSEPRSDVEGLFDTVLIVLCSRSEPRARPYRPTSPNGTPNVYGAAADISAGKNDATVFAVYHVEGDKVIIDALFYCPAPHDPQTAAVQAREFLASYGLCSAVADAYGSEITKALYREAGITLHTAAYTRSEAYLGLLPLMTTGRVELPPDPLLRSQLLSLDRHTSRSGRDTVDHRPGAHDDMANAVALAAVTAMQAQPTTGDVWATPSQFLEGHAFEATERAGLLSNPWRDY